MTLGDLFEWNFLVYWLVCVSQTRVTGDSSIVTLFVIDKKTNTPLQEVSFYSLFYFSNVFFDCKNVRSYSTGRNQNNEVEDNDWGDIIIVDLNFDNKEDIAIKSNSGGNSGANYLFYMQDENGKFTLDTSLAATGWSVCHRPGRGYFTAPKEGL